MYGYGLCLACTKQLNLKRNTICSGCKARIPPDQTTGNKSLDLFIMESRDNVKNVYDTYIRWIEYSLLMNMQEMSTLHHGCTFIANLLDPQTNGLTKVTLKKIVDRQDAQLFDFYQVIGKLFHMCIMHLNPVL